MLHAMTMAGPWSDLPLSDATKSFLVEKCGFPKMAPVQAAAIPQMLKGMDVIVEAMTGSGKTLAYSVPIFESLLTEHREQVEDPHAVHSVIIVPTRELGMQVCEVLNNFAEHIRQTEELDIRIMRAVGGYDTAHDIKHYRDSGCHVLVATPGRLFELLTLTKGDVVFRVNQVEKCILDEADKLLAMGFLAQLDDILRRLPKQRRTALFSATQTREVRELARCGLRRPVVINVRHTGAGGVETPQVPQQLKNFYSLVRYSNRLQTVVDLLRNKFDKATTKVLIYVLTCASVDWLAGALSVILPDHNIRALHGQLTMSKRMATHAEFMSMEGGVMVCTDVAARGLDIPDIDVVIQYDAPVDPRSFVHRIGRTARMGREGMSILFLAPHEEDCVAYMKLQGVELSFMPLTADNMDDKVDKGRTLSSAMMKKGDIARAKKMKLQRGEIQGDLVVTDAITTLRRFYVRDRLYMDYATRAFAAFIRGYKEHQCRYIFKFGDMDIVDLCNGFALFKVPNCSETRHMSILHIPLPEEFQNIDLKAITFADPEKEAKRLAKLDRRAQQKEVHRSERNERRAMVRDAKDVSKHQKKQLFKDLEIDEIMREGNLLKKLKLGKITEEEYRHKTGEDILMDVANSKRERVRIMQNRRAVQQREAEGGEQQPTSSSSSAPVRRVRSPSPSSDNGCGSGNDSDGGSIDTTPRQMQHKRHKKKTKKR
eukprot:PhM_4_TR58/c0_g1_i1/m.46132/K14809/DDX55, SPB4; ATP-dependent RNA helicase DDX55/SPB4